MAFWNRRKVIYNWDDNYVPTAELGDLAQGPHEFIWTCPEDRYVQLISAHVRLFMTLGVHNVNLYLELYSAQYRYWRHELVHGVPDDGTWDYYLITSGACQCTRAGLHVLEHWLPFNTRMIPGDRLRFVLEAVPAAWDHFQRYALRYNRYDLT